MFGMMGSMLILLACEYYALKDQTKRMIELREDYRNHLSAVKRVFAEYNYVKERLQELECSVEDEKKKEITQQEMLFPEGTFVYSSEMIQDSFMVVNRELEYLRQSTIDYLKASDLDMLAGTLNVSNWRDYTDELFEDQQAANKKKTTSAKSKKTTVYATPKYTNIPPEYKHIRKDLSLIWPIDRSKFWLSSHFGPRKKTNGQPGFHYGIDMAALRGTPVKAAAAGVVVQAEYVSGYGNMILIEHNQKYRTRYAHLDQILVSVGKKVAQGQFIGKVGDTGFIRKKGRDGSHLHFELLAFGKHMNPLYVL